MSVALDEVEHLRALGQRWKVEDHIALAILTRLEVFVQFDTVGRRQGITLVTYFQVGIASKLEPVVVAFRARTLTGGDIHHGLVALQLHLRQVEGEIEESVAIAGSILNGGLLPHHIFRLSRHCDESEYHG